MSSDNKGGIAGSVIGAIIGGITGGPGGAVKGALYGYSIGSVLVPPSGPDIIGPQLKDAEIQTSEYGTPIPTIHGRGIVAGSVIWVYGNDFTKLTHSETVGGISLGGFSLGGGTDIVDYTYEATLAVLLCEGEIGYVSRIWGDNTLIYGPESETAKYYGRIYFYYGTEDQEPDPLIEEDLGVGEVPAFRGSAYCVISGLKLKYFFNRIPNLKFEIAITTTSDPGLQKVLELDIEEQNAYRDYLSYPLGVTQYLSASDTGPHYHAGLEGHGMGPAYAGGGSATRVVVGVDQNDAQVDVANVFRALSIEVRTPPNPGAVQGGYDFRHNLNLSNLSYIACNVGVRSAENKWDYDTGAEESETGKVGAWVSWHLEYVSEAQDVPSGVWLKRTSNPFPTLEEFETYTAADMDLYCRDARGHGGVISRGEYFWPGWDTHELATSNNDTLMRLLTPEYVGTTADDHPLSFSINTGIPGPDQISDANWRFYVFKDKVFIFWMTTGALYSWSGRSIGDASLGSYLGKFTPDVTAEFPNEYGPDASGAYDDAALYYDDATGLMLLVTDRSDDAGDDATYVYALDVGAETSELRIQLAPEDGSGLNAFPDGAAFIAGGAGKYVTMARRYGSLEINPANHISIWSDEGQQLAGTTVKAMADATMAASALAVTEYDNSDTASVEVVGYKSTRVGPGRAIIEDLQLGYFCDLIQSGYTLKLVRRQTTPVLTITEDDLGAYYTDGEPADKIRASASPRHKMPRTVLIRYQDHLKDYDYGTAEWSREVGDTYASVEVDIPFLFTAAEARTAAYKLLYDAHNGRTTYAFALPMRYLALEPGDLVNITLSDKTLKVLLTSVQHGGWLVQCEGVNAFTAFNATLTAEQQASTGPTSVSNAGPTIGVMLDIPIINAEHDDNGVYMTMLGVESGWSGGAALVSEDEIAWQAVGFSARAGVVGLVAEASQGTDHYVVEWGGYIRVQVTPDTASLASATDAAFLNTGVNLAAYGKPGRWEIIQYKTVVDNGDNDYILESLKRGLYGTQNYMDQHAANDIFVDLTTELRRSVDLEAKLDTALSLKFVSDPAEDYFDDAITESFTPALVGQKPHPVEHVTATRDGSNNITLAWTPCARFNFDWRNAAEPTDKDSGNFEIDVMDGANVVRTIEVPAAVTAPYTAAQQTTDFGSPQNPVTLRFYALNDVVGRGEVTEVSV